MPSLLERLKASSTVKEANTLDDSILFADTFLAPTAVPILNVALSGSLDGGLTYGVTQFAGPSKHFKTLFGMICVKAYLEKFKDAVVMFYDTEFGAGWQYFDNLKIPRDRVLHIPIMNIEELKHDLAVQLEQIDRGEHVIIFVDSLGNSASKKETDDAVEGKVVADMTRAKALKSLFRIITPQLALRDIPLVAVNHTYKTLEMFSKDVVGGGTGAYYASQQVFIIGRQQEKDDKTKTILGYNFVLNIDKSRFVREKSKVILNVTFEKGINVWSGLLELAEAGGFVTRTKNSYSRGDSRKQYSSEDTNSKEFWEPVLLNPEFNEYVKKSFKLENSNLLSSALTDDDVSTEYENAKTTPKASEDKPKKKTSIKDAVNAEVKSQKSARALRREARLKKKKNA